MTNKPVKYRVANWNEHFETSESRKRKGPLDWVAMPTRMDGKRYRRVASHERAVELFAAWVLILEVAARCPARGTLVDGHDQALDAQDMADMTGFPADIFTLAFETLGDLRIGWIETVESEEVGDNCRDLPERPEARRVLLESQQMPVLHNRTGQDRT